MADTGQSPTSAAAGRPPDEAAAREAWSWSMMPLMSRMVLGLTVFFFVASALQLVYLHIEIVNAPKRDFGPAMTMLERAQVAAAATADQGLPAAALTTLATLEVNAMERRYHQANVSLLSRVWTRYLGFVTGMVLAMVGAAFILGRLETSSTKLAGEGGGWKFEILSASPGLVLATLGVALMLTTIVTHHEIQVQDRPIYAQGWSIGGGPGAPGAKPAPQALDLDTTSTAPREGQDDAMSGLLKNTRDGLRNGAATPVDAQEETGSSIKR